MPNTESFPDRVLQAWGTGNSIRPFEGGFTGASKFILDNNTFLKAADSQTHAFDAQLIGYEARIYGVLQRLGLTADLFPGYRAVVEKQRLTILGLDYLADTSWGGPWNQQTIVSLDKALSGLHEQSLDPSTQTDILEISNSVLNLLGQTPGPAPKDDTERAARNRPFLNAWDRDQQGFMTGNGEIYFPGQPDLPTLILAGAEKVNPQLQKQLILHDLNLTNIGVSGNQIRLVDPVFARLGDPSWDRTQAGINILGQLGMSIDQYLRDMVIDKFFINRNMLARLIKFFVTASATPAKQVDPKWLDLHKRSAIAALSVFSN